MDGVTSSATSTCLPHRLCTTSLTFNLRFQNYTLKVPGYGYIHLYKNPSMCVLVLTLLVAAINELCSGGPLSARAWMHWGGIEVGI